MFRSPVCVISSSGVPRPRAERRGGSAAALRTVVAAGWVAAVIGLAPGVLASPAGTSKKSAAVPKARPAPKVADKTKSSAKPVVLAPVADRKVAVFAFKGEGAESVNQKVVHVLRTKGMDVTTTLRPVDNAEQYRDMAAMLGLAVYVHGQVIDDGARAKVTVHIRSGVTGRRIASATFSGNSRTLPDDVGRGLWGHVGPALSRACAQASRPRRRENAPLRIEAGTPIENTPSQGT